MTGYNKEDGSEEEVSVQTLDKNGSMENMYFWLDITDGDDVYYGWFDMDGEPIAPGTVTLGIGDGLWVNAPNANFSLQTAGAVLSGSTSVKLREGFKLVNNPTPVAIDLTKITVCGYDQTEGSEEEVSVQTLDKNGSMENMYFWLDIIDGDDVYYGWFDMDGEPVDENSVMVDAGAALWVNAPSLDYSLTLPGVAL